MPDIAIAALNMVDSNLILETNDYAPGATDIHLALNTVISSFIGLRKKSRKVYAGDPTGQLVIAGVQDLETAQSLMNYSIANHGKIKRATVKLATDGSKVYDIDVLVVVPDTVGGQVNATNPASATWTWEIQGDPFAAPTGVVPVVSGADKTTAAVAGGTLVEIWGSGFNSVTSVQFGAVNATQFNIDSDRTIFAVAPAQAAGSKPIKVTNATGQSTTQAALTYV